MNKETVPAENAYQNSKHKNNYDSFYQRVVKRVIDVALCLISMPIVCLLFIPISLAILIEDRGPVLYISRRIGLDFKEFGMIKFRSMLVDAPDLRNDDGSTYNSHNDDRVTKVGRFLRETSLDEIPQIFNVLIGQMSIIGPRAGDVESKNTYLHDEKDKCLVRPGITGYTQAYYRNSLGVRDKRLYDAWYAHNVSFLLDFKILIKTIVTVLRKDNIYTN